MRIFLLILGSLFLLISIPFIIMAVHDVSIGADNQVGAIGAGVFFLILAVLGVFLVKKNAKAKPVQPELSAAELEQKILRLAQEEMAKITVAEITAKYGLSLKKSKAVLDEMVSQGVAEIQVSHSGGIVYFFPGLMSAEEKRNAEDIL